MLYYGLSHQDELRHHVRRVCDVLGGGKYNAAMPFMMRVAAAETGLGHTRDKFPLKHGVGVFQHDKIGFDDVKIIQKSVKAKVKAELGVDVDSIEHRDLAYSPFLSSLFCRLFLMRKIEEIPVNIEEQADYWKRHYNSALGDGSVTHFLQESRVWGLV